MPRHRRRATPRQQAARKRYLEWAGYESDPEAVRAVIEEWEA